MARETIVATLFNAEHFRYFCSLASWLKNALQSLLAQSQEAHSMNPKQFKVCSFNDLVDFHSVCCHEKVIDGAQHSLVRLPYHIFAV
jgi:hypothetical protein